METRTINETTAIQTPIQADLKQTDSSIRTIENEPSSSVTTNPMNNEEFTSNRKKKKRERSPTQNDPNAANQNGNGLVNLVSQTSSSGQSLPATSAANTNQTNILIINQTTNINANANTGKKEKQRPETWNKIEQQIFFNALRQVSIGLLNLQVRKNSW